MGYVEDLRLKIGHMPLIVVGAVVLILDESGRLLLQNRADNGLWGIPGGSMELGEQLEETARREVKEELGLEILHMVPLNFFSGAGFFYRYPNGDAVFNVCMAYVTYEVSGEMKLDRQEVTQARYFALNNLPIEMSRPDYLILEFYRGVLDSGRIQNL